MKYNDGSVFDGHFCNGRRHGNGIMTFASGNKYSGQFFNDNRQGYGEFHYASTQECYVGYWKNNMRDGRGEYRFKNGSIFRGVFKNDVKHGVGQKVSASLIYTGRWSNDKKNGVFKFKYVPTGRETLVKYVDDQRIKMTKLKNSSNKTVDTTITMEAETENDRTCSNQTVDLKNHFFGKSSKNCSQTTKSDCRKIKDLNRKPAQAGQDSCHGVDLGKRSLDCFKEVHKNLKNKRHLSSIREVSENMLSILTDEPKKKVLFFPDKQHGLMRLGDPGSTPTVKKKARQGSPGRNMIQFSKAYLEQLRFKSQAELALKSCGIGQGHAECSGSSDKPDCLRNELNRSTSVDLQIECRKSDLR